MASGGYAIIVVFLGLCLFGILGAALFFVAGQVNSMPFVTGNSAAYIPSVNTGMDLMLDPGLGVLVMFGAGLVMISMSQRKKSGEDYA